MCDIDTIRRIAERGLKQAQSRQDDYVDLWQHLLDELQRVQKAHPEYRFAPHG